MAEYIKKPYKINKLSSTNYNRSKITKNDKKLMRVLSSDNIETTTMNYSKINTSIHNNYFRLPSVGNNNYTNVNASQIIQNNNNFFQIQNNVYSIEIERLHETNLNCKILICKLKSEIKNLKKEIKSKDEVLNKKNKKIESILEENDFGENFYGDKELIDGGNRVSLIKKMRNQIKETEQEINKEELINAELKKNVKYTKSKELETLHKIFNEHNTKIISLLEYNENLNNIQDEEIYKGEILMKNLNNQHIILSKLNEKYLFLEKEEKKLQGEIYEQQQKLNKFLTKTKNVQLSQTVLKEQNMKLLKEKKSYLIKNKDNGYSLELLKKKIIRYEK